MTTLVTGHGLVGARVVDALRRRGEPAVVLDLAPPVPADGVAAVAADLRRLDDLVAAVERHRPERIVHTAELLTPAGHARPYETLQVNVAGTMNVLEAARQGGAGRVVFCSSVVVYDATAAAERVGERDGHPWLVASKATAVATDGRRGRYGRRRGRAAARAA